MVHRLPSLGLLLLALTIAVAACSPDEPESSPTGTGDQTDLRVLATVAPLADLVAEVLGDRGTVAPLVPPGAESHSYEPRPDDVGELEQADAYFGNGLGLDDGALELVHSNVGDHVPVVLLGEEVVDDAETGDDGHGHGDEDGDGHGHGHDHGHDHGGVNPHTWMSVALAIDKVAVIADVLSVVDPDGEDTYRANAADYREELEALHEGIAEAAATVPDDQRTIVTFHDAYRHFGDAYGFEVVGAVQPSDFSEPSAGDVAAIIEQIRAHDVPAVFGSAEFPDAVSEQIAAETGTQYYDDLADDVLPGEPGDPEHSYVGLMAHNARVIVEGLGGDAEAISQTRTTRSGSSSSTDRAPHNAIARAVSAVSSLSSAATPSVPPVASAQSTGRPMSTAEAPSARALTMSLPARRPPSTSTGAREPTDSTTSGSASALETASSS